MPKVCNMHSLDLFQRRILMSGMHINGVGTYIGRVNGSTRDNFGNPFSHLVLPHTIKVPTRELAVYFYREWLRSILLSSSMPERWKAKPAWKELDHQQIWILKNRDLLVGQDLWCWCAPKECHGNFLVEWANA